MDPVLVDQEPEPRFTTEFLPNSLWCIYRDGSFVMGGLEKGQAEYGAEIMNAGFTDPDLHLNELLYQLSKALAPVRCEICEKWFAAAQTHNDRCPADIQ